MIDEDGDEYVDEAAAYAAANETLLGADIESVQRKLVDDPVDELEELGVVDDVPPVCSYITAAMVIGSMKLKCGIVVDNGLGMGGVFDEDGIP